MWHNALLPEGLKSSGVEGLMGNQGKALLESGDRQGLRGLVFSSGFRVQGSGFRAQGSRFRVQGSGFRVQNLGFMVQTSGFAGFTVFTGFRV